MKLFDSVREIPITDLEGLRIGNAQDYEAMTGVTVLLFDHGAKAGIDISGGGPASRETPLTSPEGSVSLPVLYLRPEYWTF